PGDVSLADVGPGGAECNQSFDLGRLIVSRLRREVEVQTILSALGDAGRAKRDERPPSVRIADGDISILVVDNRPSDRRPPEVAGGWIRGFEHDGSDEVRVGEELPAHDDAELVVLGIREYHVVGIRPLPDVDVLRAELD